MSSGCKRVLQVIRTMNIGGAETFIMNVYRNIDREKIQFDFLVSGDGKYDKEIEQLGGKIYKIPYLTEIGQVKYVKELKKFFKEHPNYDTIHSHIDQVSGIILQTAKKSKIPTRISHSHSTRNNNNFIGRIYKKYLQSKINKNATIKLACGKDAAKWLYRNKSQDAIIINNGIDFEKFAYNAQTRLEIRKSLGIDENIFAIGHVGRFSKVKNHEFLINIFNEFQKNHEAVLILVGDGFLKKEMENKVKIMGIDNKVKFLGLREDTYRFYSAFDLMIVPSLYEGISIAMIEAQCNGLKILTSDNVDKTTDITGNIYFESLDKGAKQWAKVVEEIITHRENIQEKINKSSYNIKNIAKKMEKIYLNI